MKYVNFLMFGLLLLGIAITKAEQTQPAYTGKQNREKRTTTIQQDNVTVKVTTEVGPQSPH